MQGRVHRHCGQAVDVPPPPVPLIAHNQFAALALSLGAEGRITMVDGISANSAVLGLLLNALAGGGGPIRIMLYDAIREARQSLSN